MKKIKEIKNEFAQAGEQELPRLFELYENDGRSGVSGLIAQYKKKTERLASERKRLEAMRVYEHEYEELGLVCGIDEAGRGPLAGPVVAGAVILPKNCEILYLNDSKQLSEKRREALFDEIQEKAIACGIGMASPERIDEINILQATYEAMREAVAGLPVQPQVLLNDAVCIPKLPYRQVPIIGGDAKSLSIAAASVLAKVTRDRLMYEYDKKMPEYGFASNKGYGTAAHIEALKKYGPSSIHRKTFIGHFVDTQEWEDDRNNRAVGAEYEERAAQYLQKLGYRILCRNYRCKAGEIDLIAEHQGYMTFIEVKYRGNGYSGNAAEAVDGRKQQRIIRAASWYLASQQMSECPCRFDVVACDGEDIHVIPDAFWG